MAKRMIPAPPTKFRVGERFILRMGKHTGWTSWDGRYGVVVGPPEYRDEWECGSVDGSRNPGMDDGGWRYLVKVRGRPHLQHFCQEHMRKPRGERASTWDKFEKATGIRLDKDLVAVPTQKRAPSKRSLPGSEARHG